MTDGLFILGFLTFRCRSLCVMKVSCSSVWAVWLSKGEHSAAWLCFPCTVHQKRSSLCLHFTPVPSVVSLLSSWNCSQCLLAASAQCVPTGMLIGCLSVPVVQEALPLLPPPLHWGLLGGSVSNLDVPGFCMTQIWMNNLERLNWKRCSDSFVSVTSLSFLFDGGVLFGCWFVPGGFSVSTCLAR